MQTPSGGFLLPQLVACGASQPSMARWSSLKSPSFSLLRPPSKLSATSTTIHCIHRIQPPIPLSSLFSSSSHQKVTSSAETAVISSLCRVVFIWPADSRILPTILSLHRENNNNNNSTSNSNYSCDTLTLDVS